MNIVTSARPASGPKTGTSIAAPRRQESPSVWEAIAENPAPLVLDAVSIGCAVAGVALDKMHWSLGVVAGIGGVTCTVTSAILATTGGAAWLLETDRNAGSFALGESLSAVGQLAAWTGSGPLAVGVVALGRALSTTSLYRGVVEESPKEV